MYIPEEIQAPHDWRSVRIETVGMDADVVDDLLAEIKQTALPTTQEEGAIVVQRGTDEIGIRSFVEGVVPDLKVRGFSRATWQGGI